MINFKSCVPEWDNCRRQLSHCPIHVSFPTPAIPPWASIPSFPSPTASPLSLLPFGNWQQDKSPWLICPHGIISHVSQRTIHATRGGPLPSHWMWHAERVPGGAGSDLESGPPALVAAASPGSGAVGSGLLLGESRARSTVKSPHGVFAGASALYGHRYETRQRLSLLPLLQALQGCFCSYFGPFCCMAAVSAERHWSRNWRNRVRWWHMLFLRRFLWSERGCPQHPHWLLRPH